MAQLNVQKNEIFLTSQWNHDSIAEIQDGTSPVLFSASQEVCK